MLYLSFRFTRAKLEVSDGQVRYSSCLHPLQNGRQKSWVHMAGEKMMTRILLLLLGGLLVIGLWIRPLRRWRQRCLPNFALESEQLLLWGGLLLSALSLVLLVLYLCLQP